MTVSAIFTVNGNNSFRKWWQVFMGKWLVVIYYIVLKSHLFRSHLLRIHCQEVPDSSIAHFPVNSLLCSPVSACSRSAERARKHYATFTLILRRGVWLSLYFHSSRCYHLTRVSECRSRSCDTLFMSRHQTDFPTDGELQAYFHTCRQRSCSLHFTSSPHPAQLTAQWTPRSSRGTSSPPLSAL